MKAKASFRELYARERETLLREIRQEQAERLADISERSLIWLALVPIWTLPLASVAGFPTSEGLGVAETLKHIEAAGYCQSITAPEAVSDEEDTDEETLTDKVSATPSYTMPAATRTEVLQNVIQDSTRGLPHLLEEVMKIRLSLRYAQEARNVWLPDTVKRWDLLASFIPDTASLANWFDKLTDDLLMKKNEPGELLRWIELARPLEDLLGIELTITLGRAARRLELYHRLADDKRRLVKFLRRKEQVQAFEELIEHPEDGWALHYIGSGGVGKTMLIRHLTAELSTSLNLSTARIDFDYLNPDYPARAPGLLLVQLAEELRVHDRDGAATRLFAAFIEKMLNLHERLGASVGMPFSLAAVMGPIYDTLPNFVEALGHLPQPVVIILDTCEELSKIRVDGSIPPSVEATFGILERLHDMFPSLRVVFSGRRPLASVGAGWAARGAQLPERPYLRANEILGFTAKEARQYLGKIEKVRADAIQPIINHARKENEHSLLSWANPSTSTAQPKDSERYNPFKLSLYAAWLREDPNLTLDTIKAADADRYIDMRIVRRIKHAGVRTLLPALALLGRADFNTLRAVSGLDDLQFTNVFTDLSNQEWVSRYPAQVLEVDSGLQPDLLAYLAHTEPAKLEEVRRGLSDYLEKQTVEGERSQLDVSHFKSAFRLLKSEPDRALAWWSRIEARFAAEEAYDWLKNVCESIMGEEEDAPGTGAPLFGTTTAPVLLRVAVRASYAAALTHTGSFNHIANTWAEALLLLGQQPDEAEPLASRVRAGRLAAAARYSPSGPVEEEVKWLWQTLGRLKRGNLNTQLAASLVAAVEAVIESLEARPLAIRPDPQPLAAFAELLCAPDGYQELGRFACALTGRLFVLTKQSAAGQAWLRRALDGARLKKTKGVPASAAAPDYHLTPQTWLDWRAPEQLDARLALEFVRHSYPVLNPGEILGVLGKNILPPSTIDSDRLGSAVLQLQAASSLPLSNESNMLAQQSRYAIQHEATCNAHRSYPPLFVSVAEAFAARGRVDEALDMLRAQADSDEQSVESFASVQEADRACLRIIRLMRLRDEGQGVGTSLDKSREMRDAALLWAIDALSLSEVSLAEFDSYIERARIVMDTEELRQLLHARYRTFSALKADEAATLIEMMQLEPSTGVKPDSTFSELSLFLDCLELNQLAALHKLKKPYPQARIGRLKTANLWLDNTPSIERLILLLRHAALGITRGTTIETDKKLITAIGYRRAARIALDEGELLALRLPARAARLLDKSCRWYELARDNVGACIAKICSALALARSGQNLALSNALTKIEQGYQRHLRKYVVGLPTWQALVSLADDPQSKLFERLSPLGWRPWLVRLVACLAWQKDGYSAGERTRSLARLFEGLYGITSAQGLSLPRELDGWLNIDLGAKLVAPVERPSELSLAITQAKRSSAWQSLEPSTEVNLALQGSEAQVKARVFVNGLMPYRDAAHGLMSRLESVHAPFMRVFTALAAQPVIKVQVDHPVSWLCWEALIGMALQDLLKTEERPHRYQRVLRDSKTRRIPSWAGIRQAMTWTNDLHLADVARVGWHDLTLDGTFSHEIRDSEFLRSHRYKNKGPQVLHVIGTPTETSAGVRLDLSATRQLRQESRKHGGSGGGSESGSVAKSMGSMFKSGAASYTWSGSGGGSGTGGRGELIKAHDLISIQPQMALCILQATPQPANAISARTRDEREQAAYLRVMGADLFRSGVPMVVIIPPLALEIVPTVLKIIVNSFRLFQKPVSQPPAPMEERARPKQWDTKAATQVFLGAIAEAQTYIRSFTPVPEDARLEAAYDICFYASDVKP